MTNLPQIHADFEAFKAAHGEATGGTWHTGGSGNGEGCFVWSKSPSGNQSAVAYTSRDPGEGHQVCNRDFIVAAHELPLAAHAEALLARIDELEKENAELRKFTKPLEDAWKDDPDIYKDDPA